MIKVDINFPKSGKYVHYPPMKNSIYRQRQSLEWHFHKTRKATDYKQTPKNKTGIKVWNKCSLRLQKTLTYQYLDVRCTPNIYEMTILVALGNWCDLLLRQSTGAKWLLHIPPQNEYSIICNQKQLVSHKRPSKIPFPLTGVSNILQWTQVCSVSWSKALSLQATGRQFYIAKTLFSFYIGLHSYFIPKKRIKHAQ